MPLGSDYRNISWSPIGPALSERLAKEGGLRLIIAPFIQSDTLARLIADTIPTKGLKVITRWRPEDIVAGVSDIEVFNVLAREGVPLYINDRIHLKLFVSGSNTCFVGSANITETGLGYSRSYNIEAGSWVELGLGDWLEIYRIINSSRLVDDTVYATALEYRDRYRQPIQSLPPIALPELPEKDFTLNALPATNNPQILFDYCYGNDKVDHAPDDDNLARIYHDLVLYGVGPSVSEALFMEALKQRFCDHPFVSAVVKYIQERRSLRFGEMNAWIHANCTDVPLPYRWEVKSSTNILYNWLDFFIDEIYWEIPGSHSQVIYWREPSS